MTTPKPGVLFINHIARLLVDDMLDFLAILT